MLDGGIKASVANSTNSGTAGVTQGARRSSNMLTSELCRCPPSVARLPEGLEEGDQHRKGCEGLSQRDRQP